MILKRIYWKNWTERQQVAKLYAENERLKIDFLESEKKVSLLLSLSGLSEAELRVYLRDPKKTTIIKQRLPPKLKTLDNKLREKTKNPEITDAELSLFCKLESLETQLNVEKAAWTEEKNTFLQDRNLCKKENEAQQAKDEAHIKLLVSQLGDAQVSLVKITREIVTCQSTHMSEEKKWLAESDHLFSTISILKERITTLPETQAPQVIHQSGSFPDLNKIKSTCELKDLRRENETLKKELSETEDLRNLYENQCIKLEQEACMLKEKREAASRLYKKRVSKLNAQLDLMKKQYSRLDQRRHNESKGFCADLKRLKENIRVIVKLLYKITISLSSETPNVNFESLNDLQALATLTRTVQRVITDTKRNIMSLENQVYGAEAQDT
ncbi:coiled-coil domain-containing protein 77-like isoform X2 [Oratosquilla oratoria]|uniref:coiled-coil domain-containing protein 77-like isoform X2 n=1 Tax=Oratosquilla oratoria TaxID=337810 RepID=UPI003F758166